MKQTTRNLIRKILIYKYAFIVALSVVIGLVIWFFFRDEIKGKDIVINLFEGVLTAFLLALFYDLFTRQEQTLQINDDRETLFAKFKDDLWEVVDFGRIAPEQKERLVRRLVENQESMEILAQVITGQAEGQFYYTHILPLLRGDILCNVEVINKLSLIEPGDDSYSLEFVQRFSVQRSGKQDFFVLFSCDNDVFNSLFASPVFIDSMVGVSESDWSELDSLLKQMKLKASRTVGGQRELREIQCIETTGEILRKRLGDVPLAKEKIRGFIFTLPPEPHSYQFVFSYKVMNSLSDPYYCWFAENPMFVKSITIDYSGLIGQVGRVSANCFIGNYPCEPAHDQTKGTYRIDVDGLMWPGQGALVVWRYPKNAPAGRLPNDVQIHGH